MSDVAVVLDREAGLTQAGRAILELRQMILDGELAAGERLVETALVDRLKVSRTPVRTALARLESEGLVGTAPGGGYVVKAFGERDVFDAIEIRGTLEGLAVRVAAERGISDARRREIADLLAELDALVERSDVSAEAFSGYGEVNGRLHEALVAAAESPAIARQVELAVALPFASPSGLLMAQTISPASRVLLRVAQDQHRCLFDAILAREGSRAEAIAREHARLAVRNMRLALANPAGRRLIPGGALVAPNAKP